MTARQLHYTSAQTERTSGFRIVSATPGISRALEDLAIRASAYDAPSALYGDPDPSRYPIALGYVRIGDRAAVLYQSVYSGKDFANRHGNYFAHALLIEDVDHLFSDLLPIDLWRSGLWQQRPLDQTELPTLERLQPGSDIDADAIGRFLAETGRRKLLASLLDAVLRGLSANSQIAMITENDRAAALWVSAVSRSLPRSTVLELGFCTYIGRPDLAEPGISLLATSEPPGSLPVVDLTGATPPTRPAGAFASLLSDLWDDGAATVQAALAPLADAPAQTPLDPLVPALSLSAGRPHEHSLATLLQALTLIVRSPGLRAGPWPWDRLLEPVVAARDTQPPGSVDHEVGSLLVDLLADATVPLPLRLRERSAEESLRIFLGDPQARPRFPASEDRAIWTTLSHRWAGDLLALNERALSGLLNGPMPTLGQAVSEYLESARESTAELAKRLGIPVATLLRTTDETGPRTSRIVAIALAGQGQTDRIATLRAALNEAGSADHVKELLVAIWPRGVGTADALELFRLPQDEISTLVIDQSIEKILDDAEHGRIGPDHAALARHLLTERSDRLQPEQKSCFTAVQVGWDLQPSADAVGISRNETHLIAEALGIVPHTYPALARWLREQVNARILGCEWPADHFRGLTTGLGASDHGWFGSYQQAALRQGPTLSTPHLAQWITTWLVLPADSRSVLMGDTFPQILGQAGWPRHELSKAVLADTKPTGHLLRFARVRREIFETEWEEWSAKHKALFQSSFRDRLRLPFRT